MIEPRGVHNGSYTRYIPRDLSPRPPRVHAEVYPRCRLARLCPGQLSNHFGIYRRTDTMYHTHLDYTLWRVHSEYSASQK